MGERKYSHQIHSVEMKRSSAYSVIGYRRIQRDFLQHWMPTLLDGQRVRELWSHFRRSGEGGGGRQGGGEGGRGSEGKEGRREEGEEGGRSVGGEVKVREGGGRGRRTMSKGTLIS